jgi:integrase
MPRPKGSYGTPRYRLHKSSGQAIVTIAGRDHYLGKHGTHESRQAYNRMIAEYLLSGKQGPAASNPQTATVDQILVAFLSYANGYYKPTTLGSFKIAAKWLTENHGNTPASGFGAVQLRNLRERMTVEKRRCPRGEIERISRGYINLICSRICQMFRWAAERGLAPASVYHELRLVKRLQKGRTRAHEPARVKPVEQTQIEAVLAFATPTLGAMVKLQLLTGARSGELCSMRGCDLEVSRAVWRFTPAHHKTEHHGRERVIPIGPEAQEILKPFLKPDLTAHLFSPRQHNAELFEVISRTRASQSARNVRRRARRTLRRPQMCATYFTTITYRKGLLTVQDLADRVLHKQRPEIPAEQRIVDRWWPHQLRHNAATTLRRECGIEIARIVLGHASAGMTEVYAEADWSAAEQAIAKLG